MPSAATNSQQRYAHIDALRAFAVALVIIEHSGISKSPGDGGVTLFFTISGFIITYLLLREREKTGQFGIGSFYTKRLLKIFPPFLVAILLPTLIYSLSNKLDITAVATQVLFSFNWYMIFVRDWTAAVLPGTGILWSLAIEEQFYIVLALIWILVARRNSAVRSLVTVAVTGLVIAEASRVFGLTMLTGDFARSFLLRSTTTRMDAILFGVLIAVAYLRINAGGLVRLRHVVGQSAIPYICVIAFPLLSFLRDESWGEFLLRPVLTAIVAALFILYGLLAEETRTLSLFRRVVEVRWIQYFGLASYSLYLTSDPLVTALRPYLTGLPFLAKFILGIVICVVPGLLLYRFVEIPVLTLRKRLTARMPRRTLKA
ncbi:MAG: acyltransferase [Microbacteriaceae bacterium]